MDEQLDLWPRESPLPPVLARRWEGEDRRSCQPGIYAGEERRIPDPATEQDHPEEFGAN